MVPTIKQALQVEFADEDQVGVSGWSAFFLFAGNDQGWCQWLKCFFSRHNIWVWVLSFCSAFPYPLLSIVRRKKKHLISIP